MLNQIQACGCDIYVSLAQNLLQILKIPIQQNNLNSANVLCAAQNLKKSEKSNRNFCL